MLPRWTRAVRWFSGALTRLRAGDWTPRRPHSCACCGSTRWAAWQCSATSCLCTCSCTCSSAACSTARSPTSALRSRSCGSRLCRLTFSLHGHIILYIAEERPVTWRLVSAGDLQVLVFCEVCAASSPPGPCQHASTCALPHVCHMRCAAAFAAAACTCKVNAAVAYASEQGPILGSRVFGHYLGLETHLATAHRDLLVTNAHCCVSLHLYHFHQTTPERPALRWLLCLKPAGLP